MSSMIDAIMRLQDRFTPTVNKINTKLKEHENIQKRSAKAVKSFGQSFSGIKGAITGMVGPLMGVTAAFASIQGISNFANECMRASDAQIKVETQLEAILGNVKSIQEQGAGAVKAAKAELMDYASKLQQVGVVGDEITLAGMKQMATFQLNADQIKVLSGGMLDLLVNQKGLNATQEDAAQIGNLIGKVMQGQVGALSRVGITFTKAQEEVLKFGDANQKAATLAEVLKQNVGGVNEALAKTAQGQAQQRANAFGDQMEVLGEKIKKVRETLAVFTFPIKMAAMDAVMALLTSLESVLPYLEAAGNAAKNFGSTLMEVLETLKPFAPLLISVGGAFAYLQVAQKVGAGFTVFTTGLEAAKVALTGFKLSFIQTTIAMATNPITLAIIAIGALAAGLVYLYKNSETFRNGVNAAMVRIQEFGSTIMAKLQPAIDRLKGAWERLTQAWESTGPKISGIIAVLAPLGSFMSDVLVAAIMFAIDTIADNFIFLLDIATTIISGIITVGSGLIDFISGVFTGNWEDAWNGIQTIFSGVFDTISGIFDAFYTRIMSGINSIISAAKNLPFIGGGESEGHWTGSSWFHGGLTAVNEKGGELMNLPTGTQIIPHDQSLEQMYHKGLAAGGQSHPVANNNITVAKLADSIVVREDADIDRIASALAFKLKQVGINSMEGAMA